MTTIRAARTRPGPTVRRMRPLLRKIVLIVHIVASGSWIGVDLMLAVLVFTALLSTDVTVVGLSYQALGVFLLWPLLVTSLLSLVSGVVLGLGTKYGLVRYWWVAVKLVLNILLTVLIVVALSPSLAAAAEYGQQVAAGLAPTPEAALEVESLIFPAIVSPTALLVAMVLSVLKPWGRVRSDQRRVRR